MRQRGDYYWLIWIEGNDPEPCAYFGNNEWQAASGIEKNPFAIGPKIEVPTPGPGVYEVRK